MAKLSTFCYVLLLLPMISSGEKMVPMIEAKDCYKAWDCKGDDRCRADCQYHFKGQGEKRRVKDIALETLKPLWNDGYGTETVRDLFDMAKDIVKHDGGPTWWFCPVSCGRPLKDSPILLFLPGMDVTGLGLVVHHKALGNPFEVWCLHIPAHDCTPFEVVVDCGDCSRHRSHSAKLDLANLTRGLTLSSHGRSHPEAAVDPSSLSSPKNSSLQFEYSAVIQSGQYSALQKSVLVQESKAKTYNYLWINDAWRMLLLSSKNYCHTSPTMLYLCHVFHG
ncbi:hypothetical protein CMV_013753 [Castanea mollissima]|uniref:Uncharacterized protein n=1 Tax=Castanea mollissima TaxID=60419 RepID=A0A8J4RD91_9ROSI|nr:hypothetical protein CMV_013753 [Castanea mollissima]